MGVATEQDVGEGGQKAYGGGLKRPDALTCTSTGRILSRQMKVRMARRLKDRVPGALKELNVTA